ncbi:RicAFT regulatory complex protein RicA family protein [Sporosarcina thermotolerans]|uniref:RicAFT regulatory complex protein RicA family protein n=1 Tax=Sporosarcina thermotolerans TaxID=633404 RepID=A0AAW9A7A0_9BACL|nr:RicAFT regulatory complex protein RicA family protein [Sporosarcina thermotolerans]MDW0115660.1 RicAFT regulatory complex protein RicA family protein [Sporosarcina thermotolerans]WHT47056.1 RicAFT regulatory complex protein RicA family protein [Sporosarcina thermotolerans]
MEKLYTKEEIIEKAREIAHMIANTEQVEFFKRAEEQINENQKIREKIASLRSLQTQAVNFQMYEKARALEIIEGKIEKIQEEIDEVPIVQEFKQSQVEVNDLLQLVSNTISNSVTDEIIESTGGDVRGGKTGSYVENTKPKPLS